MTTDRKQNLYISIFNDLKSRVKLRIEMDYSSVYQIMFLKTKKLDNKLKNIKIKINIHESRL